MVDDVEEKWRDTDAMRLVAVLWEAAKSIRDAAIGDSLAVYAMPLLSQRRWEGIANEERCSKVARRVGYDRTEAEDEVGSLLVRMLVRIMFSYSKHARYCDL